MVPDLPGEAQPRCEVVQTYNSLSRCGPPTRVPRGPVGELEEMRRYPDLVEGAAQAPEIATNDRQRTPPAVAGGRPLRRQVRQSGEAVRAYEAFWRSAPRTGRPSEFLSKMYKQRRRLAEVRRHPPHYIERLEDPAEKAARPGRDRPRSPSTGCAIPCCPETLWLEVLDLQADNEEAMASLSKVYEREKSWDKLPGVLERRLQGREGDLKKELLEKLGGIYADRLGNRERAVEAFESLIAIEPEHRRAATPSRRATSSSSGGIGSRRSTRPGRMGRVRAHPRDAGWHAEKSLRIRWICFSVPPRCGWSGSTGRRVRCGRSSGS